MKTTRLLRVLSLLGFLLLLAPFYDSCNGQRMKKMAEAPTATIDSTTVEIDSTAIDTTEINKIDFDTVSNSAEIYETPFYQKAYEFIDDDDSENPLEFSKIFIDDALDFNYNECKKGIKEEGFAVLFFHLKNLCFLLIVITTLLISIFSFKNIQWVHKLSRVNIILLMITVICLFLEGLFETITQIKWGYYAFIITNLLILYYSKKNKIPT